MSFHDGITVAKLEKAVKRNPDGVRRLARFVGAEGPGVLSVLRACQRLRDVQALATRVRDRRAR